MRRRRSAAAVGIILLTGALLATSTTEAADHLDSPRTQADPAADINDLYAFRGTSTDLGDQETTVFIMTLFPQADANARFSDAVSYNFRIVDSADDTNSWTISCSATTPDTGEQTITCETSGGVTDSVEFNAVEPGTPSNETMRIYAGLVDDPFFFDLMAFNSVLGSVLDGAPAPGPLLDQDGTDFFADLNTLAIVVEIDNSVFGSSTVLRVSADTWRSGPDM